LLNAVYELTRPDRREGTSPCDELRDDVKHCCWQLLGPPPGHPLYEEIHSEQQVQAEKVKKPRGKGR